MDRRWPRGGPRASTDLAILAAPAPAAEASGLPESPGERALPIDVEGARCARVPLGEREEARWLDLPGVRDEHDAVAVAQAEAGPSGRTDAGFGTARPFRAGLLEGHAPVVGRLGRRDDERGVPRPLPEPHEESLARAGRQLAERAAAADLDEEEETPPCGPGPVDQVRDGREVGEGLGRRERVHLERDAFFDSRSDGRHRPIEAARHAPEPVVPGGVGAVQAERHGFDPRAPELPDDLGGEGRRAAGRHRDAEAEPHPVLEERPEVGPLQRIASRQHHAGRRRGRSQRIEQPPAFRRAQLEGVAVRDRLGAAVPTGEITRPGQLPVDPERCLVEDQPPGPPVGAHRSGQRPRNLCVFSSVRLSAHISE